MRTNTGRYNTIIPHSMPHYGPRYALLKDFKEWYDELHNMGASAEASELGYLQRCRATSGSTIKQDASSLASGHTTLLPQLHNTTGHL